MDRIEGNLDSLIPRGDKRTAAPIPEACSCGGSGMVAIERTDGSRAMRDCSCRIQKRIDGRLEKAGIPALYRAETLDTFQAIGEHASKGRALAAARGFVENYPVGTKGRGLLLVGPVGVGKTHLAVGILRELILERGAAGLFCDFRQLMAAMKETYGRRGKNEAEILAPVFAADVVILDELGGARRTDWSFETIESILNGRYNDQRSTIITTNLANAAPKATDLFSQGDGDDYGAASLRQVMTGETLGDRIGARMHSRLQQMCQVVNMAGDDYRQKKGKL